MELVRGAARCGPLERDALLAAGGRIVPGDLALWGAAGERVHWCPLWRLQEEAGGTVWDGAGKETYLLPGCVRSSLCLFRRAPLSEAPSTWSVAPGYPPGPPPPWNKLFRVFIVLFCVSDCALTQGVSEGLQVHRCLGLLHLAYYFLNK